MPDKWQYWQDIGFVYYWNVHDYRKAARRRSSAAPTCRARRGGCGRSRRPRSAKGGDRGASRLLWQQIYDTANNDYARNAARMKLQQLDAIEIIERLQRPLTRLQPPAAR